MEQLPNLKAPGEDCLPIKFFEEFSDITTLTLAELAKEIKTTRHLRVGIKKGKIILIPKSGNPQLVTNYRSITLLNSTYKIQAKLLAARLKPMLLSLICSSQTGFVPRRSIFENIFTVKESMERVVESHQNLVLMLLDYEKAFDRVN